MSNWSLVSILQASSNLLKPIQSSLSFEMISKPNLEPLESTSKAIFNPIKVLEIHLVSMHKVKPCKNTADKIQLLWNQLASLQPLGWLPMLILKPMRILSKPIFNQKRVLPKAKLSFFSKELAKSPPFRNQTASLQSIRWVHLLIFKPRRVLPKPIINMTWVLQRV